VKSQRWLQVLPQLEKQINNTYHRVILTTPHSVSKDNEGIIWLNSHFSIIGKTPPKPRYAIGDIVLISKSRLLFEKGFTVGWNSEPFRITKVNIFPEVITYKLEDLATPPEPLQGEYYTEELQKIDNGSQSPIS